MAFSPRLIDLLRRTWASWMSHEAQRVAAALSYYTLLSLAPLVIFSIAMGGIFFGGAVARQHLIWEVHDVAGPEVARVIEAMLQNATKPASATLASIIGLVTLLAGASGVFIELRDALNAMWGIRPVGSIGFRGMLRDRLFSMGMVLAVGFLMVVSLLMSAVLTAAGHYASGMVTTPVWMLVVLNLVISFAGITGMFALVLRYVPDAELPWRDVWAGAVVNSVLFTAGKALIGWYLGRAAPASLYGAGASTVVVIVWVYYSAQLFLFGSQFARVYGQQVDAETLAREGIGALDLQPKNDLQVNDHGKPSAV